jgi:hypothetical protein
VSAHTPESWDEDGHYRQPNIVAGEMTIATVRVGTGQDGGNARLIAAAPDLLAALRAIEAHHVEQNRQKGRPEERSTTLRLARAAIAKAEGRT